MVDVIVVTNRIKTRVKITPKNSIEHSSYSIFNVYRLGHSDAHFDANEDVNEYLLVHTKKYFSGYYVPYRLP